MNQDVRVEVWRRLAEADWTPRQLAVAMVPAQASQVAHQVAVNLCALELLFAVDDPALTMGPDMAAGLALAFQTSVEFWLELERQAPEKGEESTETT